MLSSCFSCHGLHHRPWAHRQGPFQQNASPALQALPDPRFQLDNQGAWTGLGLGLGPATCQGLESIGDYEEPGLGVVVFTWIGASAISHFVLKTSPALLGKTFSA